MASIGLFYSLSLVQSDHKQAPVRGLLVVHDNNYSRQSNYDLFKRDNKGGKYSHKQIYKLHE